jgi:competence protein ComEC
VAARLRAAAIKSIQTFLPEPHASLAAGVLLGGSGQLSAEFRQQLQRSGLGHIVAIDGYKQVMVSTGLGWAAVRLFGRPLAAGPILLGVLAYTLLTGVRPSAVRAGLMVGLATTAGVVGRLPDSLTSLLLAAVAMAGFDPDVLLDIGFQLSFSATLGLILLWPRLRRLVRGVPAVVAEPAGITLAVTLATLPVTLSVFQSVSLISPLAHVVGMPLLPPVLLGAALIALAAPLPPLASAVAWLAWWPTELLVQTVRISGNAPAAALSTGQLPPLAAVALSLVLLAWGVWQLPELAALRQRLASGRMHTARTHRLAAPLAAAGLSLVGVALLLLVRPDGSLHVDRLDVAPGEAVLIRGPTGRTVLVAQGRIDAFRLVSQVGQQLAVWEHGLHAAVSLDAEAEPRLATILDRYPAEQRLNAGGDRRLELGGGAVLDVYAMPGQPAAAVSFGRVWVPLVGHPPRPLHAPDGSPPVLVEADAQQLVADGIRVWRPDQLRSGPTTSAARPAPGDRARSPRTQ